MTSEPKSLSIRQRVSYSLVALTVTVLLAFVVPDDISWLFRIGFGDGPGDGGALTLPGPVAFAVGIATFVVCSMRGSPPN